MRGLRLGRCCRLSTRQVRYLSLSNRQVDIRRVVEKDFSSSNWLSDNFPDHPLDNLHVYSTPEPLPNDHIVVAMSSGVDSSTIAAMLAQQYPGQVSGIYMSNWSSYAKCNEAEWNDVQRVCKHIGISCERVNFQSDYWIDVFEPMLQMYKQGRTPNPDVSCNRHIKFGRLYEYLHESFGGKQNWWLATGHYARVGLHKNTSQYHLLRPYDRSKDQSYYLSTIIPSKLSRVLFPLANYKKSQVRDIAKQLNLPTAAKPDSQGLCFVSQEHNNFKHFLQEYVEPSPGNIVTEDGRIVGRHQGLWQATIGQRSGVSMPQADPSCQGVWYVSDKNYDKNELVIVHGRDHPSLYSSGAVCTNFNWLGTDIDLSDLSTLTVQYRSLQEPQTLQGIEVDTTESVSRLSVTFFTKQKAVSPGQYLVLYQGDRVLGSGPIDERFN